MNTTARVLGFALLGPLGIACTERSPVAPAATATIAAGPPSFNFSNNVVGQGARRPTTSKFHIDRPPGVVGSCGTFDILEGTVGDIITTTFYNQGGEPESMQVHWNLIHTWSNSVTGQSISSRSVGNGLQEFETGTFGVAGAPFVLTIEAEGIVIKDAGLLVLDADGKKLFEAGTHDFGPNGDPTTLCPRLA